jgi:ATP-binding cassette, subfamily B, multidrug efflux pump
MSFLSAGSRRHRNVPESDWRLLGRLLPYARQNTHLLIPALLLLIPLAIAGAAQPIIVGQVISLIRQEPNTISFLRDRPLGEGINILAGILLCTVTIQLTLQGLQGFLVQKVGQQMTAAIRDDLFEHVTALAMRFFDRTPVGKLITRLTGDVEALGDVFSTGAVGVIGDLFAMLVYAIAMFWLQWQLATVLILLLIPIAALIIYFQQQYRTANYRSRDELSALNATFQENLVGVNIVQLFRRERYNTEQFKTINQRYINEVDRTIFYDSAVSATLEWVGLAAIAGVLWVGGQQVLGKTLEFGVLSSFILFAQRLFDPLRQFAEKFTAIQAGFTSIERIADILNEPIEIRDGQRTFAARLDTSLLESGSEQSETASSLTGKIEFEHVWFAYKDNDYILKDLSLTIQPGEKVAFVGPTGAGKSSIIRLLCRLYEPQQGRILLDGEDIRDFPQQLLRQRMGVILQDGFLFAGDVKSNISLGERYSLSDIHRAAVETNVADFIERLPNQYDTQLRERGTNLSGGQKQLLAFARAAIRNPSILVLDEATASLDVSTEVLIQQALERLLRDRTAIIIAHRLSTIRNVDRILVLRKGELIESGSHEELLADGGVYASLYKLQRL